MFLGKDGVWAGRTLWSNVCPKDTLARVVDGLGTKPKEKEALSAKSWHLSEFEDDSSPRPGTQDLFFRRSEDQSTLERPIIYYDQYEYIYEDETTANKKDKEESSPYLEFIPVGAAALLVMGTFLFLLIRRK